VVTALVAISAASSILIFLTVITSGIAVSAHAETGNNNILLNISFGTIFIA
jgi:hypothetical protein